MPVMTDPMLPEIGKLIVKVNNSLMDYVAAEEEALKLSNALAEAQLSWGRFQQACSSRYAEFPADAGSIETLGRLHSECGRLSAQVGGAKMYAAGEFAGLAAWIGRLLCLWNEYEKRAGGKE